eukprot:SAG22_NODE_7140_length_772_cov_0.741456_2_plen_118_part_01
MLQDGVKFVPVTKGMKIYGNHGQICWAAKQKIDEQRRLDAHRRSEAVNKIVDAFAPELQPQLLAALRTATEDAGLELTPSSESLTRSSTGSAENRTGPVPTDLRSQCIEILKAQRERF